MRTHLNTLFVTTEGSHLAKDGECVLVRRDGEVVLRVPLLSLTSIVCFGRTTVSTPLLEISAAHGVAVSFHSRSGRFLARCVGPTSGNVLLRRDQYRIADSADQALAISRAVVVGKIVNCRSVLLRAARDRGDPSGRLSAAADEQRRAAASAAHAGSAGSLRGVEGDAARAYFSAFGAMIASEDPALQFRRRSRRPPLDAVNAMLSFAYALLAGDTRAACESVGLDPQVGFFHRDRPGRAGLALDLMEELRAIAADRVVLTLINRRQVRPRDFETQPGGAVRMSDQARKTLLIEIQKRKQTELRHPYLGERTTLGFVPFLQARLLARHLRGDLDGYPPFLAR